MINVVSASSMMSGPTMVTFSRNSARGMVATCWSSCHKWTRRVAWACRRYLRAAMVEIRRLRRGAHRNNAPVDDLDLDFALHDPVALFIFGFETAPQQISSARALRAAVEFHHDVVVLADVTHVGGMLEHDVSLGTAGFDERESPFVLHLLEALGRLVPIHGIEFGTGST